MIDYEKIISPVVSALPPSGIRKFFDIVAEMDDAISLGVGEPDFTTPWAIREAGIYSLEKGQTHYTANAGLMELREEICNYYDRKFDIKYNPKKEVLVTVGGSEAIDLMVRTFVIALVRLWQAVFLFRLKQKKRTISDFCRNS